LSIYSSKTDCCKAGWGCELHLPSSLFGLEGSW
jgi:hypothetical protein